MRRRLFILHNPNAGRAARNRYHSVLRRLRDHGAQVTSAETARHGEGLRAAAAAARSGAFDAVVAAGGDGTMHDAAAGLIGSDTPLGLIPTGTANVFARELGLPSEPDRLADLLLAGGVRTLPLGRIDGRPFLFVVGVGLDAEAVRHFERGESRRLGRLGLAWPVARALWSWPGRALRVVTDGAACAAEWVLVTRAPRYAGGLLLTPDAALTATRLHVIRFGGDGRLVRLRQLAALACGRIRFDPDVTVEPASRVRIEGDPATPVQVDGELLGRLPVDIDLHPEPLAVIAPGGR